MTVVELLDACDRSAALVNHAFEEMHVFDRRDYFEAHPEVLEGACRALVRQGYDRAGFMSFMGPNGQRSLPAALRECGYALTMREALMVDDPV